MKGLLAAFLAASMAMSASAVMPYERITGLVAAVYTPFNDKMELDVSMVPSQAKYLNDTGVHHVLVAGTTGESVKLTVAERKALAEAWASAAPKYDIKIYVHIAANALADARELARHAESISAAGLVAMSTTYFRPSTVDALVDELQYMFSAAPSLPAWYYHIPSMTGDNDFKGFNMYDFLAANQGDGGDARIPNLVGVKFTDYDLFTFKRCEDFDGGAFNLLYGRDEQLLGAAAMGAKGAVGSTYNFAGRWGNAVLDAVADGNLAEARKHQESIVALVAIYGKPEYAGTDPGKEIANLLGIRVGAPRLPAKPMTEAQREQLKKDIQAIGLLR